MLITLPIERSESHSNRFYFEPEKAGGALHLLFAFYSFDITFNWMSRNSLGEIPNSFLKAR